MGQTITLQVNGKQVTANQGEMILDVLRRNQVHVPTLCHIKDLFPSGSCRLCIVEIEGRFGTVPSCATLVEPGMSVYTHTPRLLKNRKTILELLLANHPDDCLYCERSGICELQSLAKELQVDERRFKKNVRPQSVDRSSSAIIRDNSKCVLCGRCVRVCEEIMGVSCIDFIGRGSLTTVAPAFQEGMGQSTCVNCGQCIKACPTGALYEKSSVQELMDVLGDPNKYVVIQHAPSVSVTIGEYFNITSDEDISNLLNGALKQAGFNKVFDTSFTADLTIMEEASEFVERVASGSLERLPMLTSCSPGWIKYIEQFYPEFIPNLSTCKSPQQMMGALIKHYYAEKIGQDPRKIVSVSIMPCTAKKYEIERPEMNLNGISDVDIVLTTRELAKLLSMLQIDLNNVDPVEADNPFGEYSSAGKIFGVTGGVMEAALRTAYYQLTNIELPIKEIEALRKLDGIKEASVDINGTKINVAVVSGLENARKMLESIKSGEKNIHFMEVMTCPGGCISGGGQPKHLDVGLIRSRMQKLYKIDKDAELRTSHNNLSVKQLYNDFLGKPLGEKSHKYLHTHYVNRGDVV